ncbi:MAG: dihydrolipoamide acetyltransferase family protein [Candidatus Reddybacter sp.]
MTSIFKIPELGDGDITGIVVALAVNIGDTVRCGDSLLEVETEKAILEIPAEIDGVIEDFLVNLEQEVKQGEDFISIKPLAKDDVKTPVKTENAAEPVQQAAPPAPQVDKASTGDKNQQKSIATIPQNNSSQCLPAGPATRRLARELGVDLTEISGSGHRGRLDKAAVKAFAKQALKQKQTGIAPIQATPLPDLNAFGPNTRQPMTGIQKATSRNMTHAATRIPHAWLQRRIDITELEQGRQQHKAQLKSEGCALTLTALLCKIVGLACARHPIFNSSLDEQSEEIVYREQINVGIAVDTSRGLLVPVINDISNQSVKDIAGAITHLSEKARAAKLQPADMKGGSITLSNLGGLGASGVFPIINWPEVAILGVGAGEWVPTYVGGNINAAPEPRLIMPLTLAFDHRVINGADGARFLDTIAELCENPFLVMVG